MINHYRLPNQIVVVKKTHFSFRPSVVSAVRPDGGTRASPVAVAKNAATEHRARAFPGIQCLAVSGT